MDDGVGWLNNRFVVLLLHVSRSGQNRFAVENEESNISCVELEQLGSVQFASSCGQRHT